MSAARELPQASNAPVDSSALRAAFSQELGALAAQFADRPVCRSEILAATKGRGFHLLLVLLALGGAQVLDYLLRAIAGG